MRRGKSSGSLVRLGVLSLILIGVGIFGWVRRPDLVRTHLGVNAPAWNTTQALVFTNAELFKASASLKAAQEEQVRTIVRNEVSKAMSEQIGSPDASRSDKGTVVSPATFTLLRQAERDAKRAIQLLPPDGFRSTADQTLLWKTIDLANEIIRSIHAASNKDRELSEIVQHADALRIVDSILAQLKNAQEITSPERRETGKNTAIKPDEMGYSADAPAKDDVPNR